MIVLVPTTGEGADDDPFQLFEEEAKTTTASRRLQPTRESPVAVDVITAEEIEASGAVHLWDLLRFRVGMDVLDARSGVGGRAIVSVRGFPREYVNNMLVLVDGRSVYSAYSGGVDWEQLPVQIQDIERIEIIRGPNAALYGSNAGLGVINIITHRPEEENALAARADVGNQETVRSALSVQSRFQEAFPFRLSYSYQSENFFVTPSGRWREDSLRSNKVNFRGGWHPAGAEMDLFLGGSWDEMTVPRSREGEFRTGFGMWRFSKQVASDASLEIMTAYTAQNAGVYPDLAQVDYAQFDLEALYRQGWGGGLFETTWGGNYRHSAASSLEVFLEKPPQRSRLLRGFVHQTAKPLYSVILVGALSYEDSNTSGWQPAYQLAALWTPVEHHTLRISYALAPTLPDLYERGVMQIPSPAAHIVGNPSLRPERLHSYEAGYRGTFFLGRLEFESNLFYMKIDDVSASFVEDPTAMPVIISFGNRNRAAARGVETKFVYWLTPATSTYVNYTFERIEDRLDDVVITTATPRHKVNLGGTVYLGSGFSAGMHAGYKSGYTTAPANRSLIESFPAYWRLDARLAYRPIRSVEVALAGQNLLSPRHREYIDFDGLEVPRTYYGEVSVRF